jgi:DNA-binding MarR family transcriptional regulator
MLVTMDIPSEPRWLDPDEQQTWLALGSMLIRLPGALDAQLQRDAGISHFEYAVLAGLSEAPDRTLRMSDLAILAEGSLPRLSQVVSRLEKRGWVRRTPDPADGRYTLAILTGQGWEKVAATAPGHVETVRRLVFDPLTKAQSRQLREIGRRVMRAIDPDDRCLDDDSWLPPPTALQGRASHQTQERTLRSPPHELHPEPRRPRRRLRRFPA